MNKKLVVLLVVAAVIFGGVWFLQQSSQSAAILWKISDQGQWLFPLVTVAALIDSVNPCAFSILLLTIAFLFSLGMNKGGILKAGGIYILGLFTVYVLIGLGILQVLHLFNTPHFMAKVGAIVLVGWGVLELTGHFWPRFPVKLRIPSGIHGRIAQTINQASLPAAFFLGVLVGLCEFPCTGGPYLMVLGLLHDQSSYWRGLGYLLFYNLIFVVPLAVVLLIASERSLLTKVQDWRKHNLSAMKLYGGLAMVGLGLLIWLL